MQKRQIGVGRPNDLQGAGLDHRIHFIERGAQGGVVAVVGRAQVTGNFAEADADRVACRYIAWQAEHGDTHAVDQLACRMAGVGEERCILHRRLQQGDLQAGNDGLEGIRQVRIGKHGFENRRQRVDCQSFGGGCGDAEGRGIDRRARCCGLRGGFEQAGNQVLKARGAADRGCGRDRALLVKLVEAKNQALERALAEQGSRCAACGIVCRHAGLRCREAGGTSEAGSASHAHTQAVAGGHGWQAGEQCLLQGE